MPSAAARLVDSDDSQKPPNCTSWGAVSCGAVSIAALLALVGVMIGLEVALIGSLDSLKKDDYWEDNEMGGGCKSFKNGTVIPSCKTTCDDAINQLEKDATTACIVVSCITLLAAAAFVLYRRNVLSRYLREQAEGASSSRPRATA